MNELVASNTALTPEQAFPFQKEIDTWSMENAVAELRPKVELLKKASVDVCRMLYIAHTALAQRGGDRRSEDAQTFGFCDFLELVGISKKTAYVWLKMYNPATDSFRTPEEYALENAKNANPEVGGTSPAVQQLQTKKEQLIAHAMATGERLYEEGWNELGCEEEYRRRKDNERFAELARTWGKQKIKLNWGDDDYFSQTLLKNGKLYTKINLESKEQMRAQLEVFDMLAAFLSSFENPQTRLAAVCNIGLRVRQLVNEIAEQDRELNAFTGVQE